MNLQGVNFKAEINPDDPNRCFVEYTSPGEVATGVSFAFPDYIKHRFQAGDRMVLPTAMIKKYVEEKKELKVVLTEVTIDCDDNVYLENCALSHIKINGDIKNYISGQQITIGKDLTNSNQEWVKYLSAKNINFNLVGQGEIESPTCNASRCHSTNWVTAPYKFKTSIIFLAKLYL